jgi:spore coat protein U-like protein
MRPLIRTRFSRRTLGPALALWLASSLGPAFASCSVNATGLVFGNYDPFSDVPLDGASTVTVTCSSATNYSIALSAGNGTFASRLLVSDGHSLEYNLYTDSTRTMIWGDGSSGTSVVSGEDAGSGTDHTVYGRIPSGQNPLVGTYTDTITVTVSF